MNGWYEGFGFYHGPDDSRLLVPKRIPVMGWTINVSHPRAPLVLLVFGALISAAILSKMLA